jgi:hypothetical protein
VTFLDADPSSTENKNRLGMTDVAEAALAGEMSRIGPITRIAMAVTVLALTGVAVARFESWIELCAAREARRAVAAGQDQRAGVTLKDRLIAEPGCSEGLFDHGHDEEGARRAMQILVTRPEDPEASRLLTVYHERGGETGPANSYRMHAPAGPEPPTLVGSEAPQRVKP